MKELQASKHLQSQLTKHSHSLREPTFHTSQPPVTTTYMPIYHYLTNRHTPVTTPTFTILPTVNFNNTVESSRAIMYYLIQTPHHTRPYLSTVSFIANDFANWGCRVTCHANNSAYITEIRYQEKRNRPGSRRIELMEVWAKEVLARKSQQEQPPQDISSRTDTTAARKARASAFAQDFVSSLSAFGTCRLRLRTRKVLTLPESPLVAPRALPNDPLPLPAYPQALVAKYTRLIHRCAYTSCAALPSWADPDVAVADQVALEFRFEKSLSRDHLSTALNEAIGKASGRMGKVEKCKETGLTKVLMWVDVGDLLGRDKVEEEEPVPLYERGAWVWPPRYEDPEVAAVR